MIRENNKRIKSAIESAKAGVPHKVTLVAPITAKPKNGSGEGFYANTVDMVDAANNVVGSIVYRPYQRLGCGAQAWVETKLKLVNRDNPAESVE